MERLIQSRLAWFLECQKLLPDEMTGFRQKLSASDSLLDFVSSVEREGMTGNTTLAVSFDVEKAFGNVRIPSVLQELARIGITGRVQMFLSAFVSDRCFQVRQLGTP